MRGRKSTLASAESQALVSSSCSVPVRAVPEVFTVPQPGAAVTASRQIPSTTVGRLAGMHADRERSLPSGRTACREEMKNRKDVARQDPSCQKNWRGKPALREKIESSGRFLTLACHVITSDRRPGPVLRCWSGADAC